LKDPRWSEASLASPGTPLLEARDLQVLRGGRAALEASHLSVQPGEVLAVIGPNGAGKSTLLLALARLIRPARGQVLFRGQPLEALDELAYRRHIGLVLQEPLLLDASVFENVALGLRFRGRPQPVVAQSTQEWLERLGIAHLSKRPARRLSGGEAQRASLARAFALQPEVLLLDEPFSALDAPTRRQLLEDFQALLAATGITTVFITHDLDEALALGDQVAVLLKGRLRQTGQPDQVFNAPADEEVAAFVGVETVIPARVAACQDGQVVLEVNRLKLEAVGEMQAGRAVLFCLRPEDVTLWPAGENRVSSARNRLSGRIVRMAPQGPLVRVQVDCGFPLTALITCASAREMGFAAGQMVTAAFKASAVHLIPR
jgi:tungstate transport system ATP-binding protein